MGKVCDICGVTGYADTIVTCLQCGQASEHMYCMKEHVIQMPQLWSCEPCRSRCDLDPSSLTSYHQIDSEHNSLFPSTSGAARLKTQMQMEMPRKKRKTIRLNNIIGNGLFIPYEVRIRSPRVPNHFYKGNNFSKTSENCKVKFIPVEEAAVLASGSKTKSWDSGFLMTKTISPDRTRPTSTVATGSAATKSGYYSKSKYDVNVGSVQSNDEKEIHGMGREGSGIPVEEAAVLASGSKTKSDSGLLMTKTISPDRTRPTSKVATGLAATKSGHYSRLKCDVNVGPVHFNDEKEIRGMGREGSGIPVEEAAVLASGGKTSGFLMTKTISPDRTCPTSTVATGLAATKSGHYSRSKYDVNVGSVHSNDEKEIHGMGREGSDKETCIGKSEKSVSEVPMDAYFGSSIEMTKKPVQKSCNTLIDINSHLTEESGVQRKVASGDSLKNLDAKTWDPAEGILWKGSFEIFGSVCDGNIYTGIWAHAATNLSPKAYEASKKLPNKLLFNILPCAKLWPRFFQKCPPVTDDVALYFSPGNFESSKQQYIHFLELLERQDLAIRCCLADADLLIFTSKKLHVESHELKIRRCLWGVFRSVSASVPFSNTDITRRDQFFVKDGCCNQLIPSFDGNAETVDMDVDMVGGKHVGLVDKVVPRLNSIESKSSPARMINANTGNTMRSGRSKDLIKLEQSANSSITASIRNKKTLTSASYTCSIKQEESLSAPLALNLKNEVGFGGSHGPQKGSIYPPSSEKLTRGNTDMPTPKLSSRFAGPAHEEPQQQFSTTGSARLLNKRDLTVPSSHGFSKQDASNATYEVLTPKSVKEDSTEPLLLDVPPGFSKLTGPPKWKEIEISAVKVESELDRHQVEVDERVSEEVASPSSGCLHLFPVEAVPEASKGKVTEKMESLCLSLSRPLYSRDGNSWITSLSKESIDKDGSCDGKKLQLTL